MTSAARPTWSAALGNGSGLRDGSSAAPTLQTCAKDQPGHLKLKLRQFGQDAPEEVKERRGGSRAVPVVGLITGDSDVEIESDSEQEDTYSHQHSKRNDATKDSVPSASDPEDEKDYGGDAYSEEEEDDDDEEEELMRELEKIKRERELEKLERERKVAEKDPHAVLAGNPLLATDKSYASAYSTASTGTFGVKRRWDDDVVFKNQAKNVNERPEKRFINDTTRSDFHRRFLDKYIK
jgi:protein CWC15